jgi:hypothetical protein
MPSISRTPASGRGHPTNFREEMMAQEIFMFNYTGFRREVEPLVLLADKGDYSDVLKKARALAEDIQPGTWILENLGTSLQDFKDAKPDHPNNWLRPGPHLTGFSFLVILSQFLTPIPVPPPRLSDVGHAASALGWSRRDVELLSIGMATTALLKPELVPDPLERPSGADSRWNDPAYYWWWLRPEHAFYTGWWDLELIAKFHQRLSEMRKDFEQIDVAALSKRTNTVQSDLIGNYEKTVKVFSDALAEQTGLFQIIAQ